MRIRFWFFLALVFFLLSALQTNAQIGVPEVQMVTAWGEVVVTKNKDADRQRALVRAQRNALEQVVGVYVSSRTLTQNFTVVEDRIYSNSEGFINGYELLQEKQTDMYSVQIRATVSLEPVTDILRKSGLLRQWRIGVVLGIDERFKSRMLGWYSQPRLLEVAASMESEISSALIDAGFKLVDPRHLGKVRTARIDALKVAGNLGQHLDLLVVGTMSVSAKSAAGGVNQGICQLHGKVVRIDTGEIVYQGNIGNTFDGTSLLVDRAIAEKYMDSHGNGELSDGTPDLRTFGGRATDAINKAVRLASVMAGDIMVSQISRIPASVRARVALEISGLDFDQLVEMEDQLNQLDGVARVTTESVFGDVQTMEVEYDGNAMGLAKAMSRSSEIRKLGLKVKNVTKNKIVLMKK